MPQVDILLPTYNRIDSLLMTIAGLASQTFRDFRITIADQSSQPSEGNQVIRSLKRINEILGSPVEFIHRPPVWGIAEQREFLLSKSTAPYVLFLDDDVFMEPWVLSRMISAIEAQNCGFVGAFPNGLSYLHDVRPDQQRIEFWEGPVQPEAIDPEGPGWERFHLHRAANLFHVSQNLNNDEGRLYKVAWVASCILYDRQKLLDVGGFSFWNRLPRYHSGEEVLVQNLLMRRWGGCGIIPSGTYHSELPSTVLNDSGTVDGHALNLLPEMVERFASQREINRVPSARIN